MSEPATCVDCKIQRAEDGGDGYRIILCPKHAAVEELAKALEAAQGALGMHGPCKQNSCRDCKYAWKLIQAALARIGATNATTTHTTTQS